jgi:signal recognition particle receptor subunit beta
MASASSEEAGRIPIPKAVKIVVSGGFGAGKTTMVGSVSEIRPLRTEEVITEASIGVDDMNGLDRKRTTTVALDFGRISINPQLVLYLFGTPGQDRFWFMWDELVHGALGAVVLVDTRRLDTGFAAIDFFEDRRLPFVVAVNRFEGAPTYNVDQVRSALDLDSQVPIVLTDARQREESKTVLVTLLEDAIKRLDTTGATAGTN